MYLISRKMKEPEFVRKKDKAFFYNICEHDYNLLPSIHVQQRAIYEILCCVDKRVGGNKVFSIQTMRIPILVSRFLLLCEFAGNIDGVRMIQVI